MLGGGYKSSGVYALTKMLVLATVPVHETNLANQLCYSMLQKSTFSMLVKMLKVMNGPLVIGYQQANKI